MKTLCTSLLLCLALFIMPLASSSQVKEMPLEALVRQAEVIVVGKVASLRSEWNSNRTRIYTTVTIAVDENLKGNGGQSSLSVVSQGGEINGIGELYSHSARFTKNESVVVFAERDSRGVFHVTGGEQGKFSVKKEERTDKQMVSEQRTLDEFKTRIRLAAQPKMENK